MKYFPYALLFVMVTACTAPDRKNTERFELTGSNGLKAEVTPYGARLMSLWVKGVNVVEGFDQVSGYQGGGGAYYGATIGRYANRIAGGRFSLDGKVYQLPVNDGKNTLHGGPEGLFSKWWDARRTSDSSIIFSYRSKAGDEGFPGDLVVTVTYILDGNNLRLRYEAVADSPTVTNLTNHAFWNLNGEGSGSIGNHVLQINGDQYTPVDAALIPTGKIEPVKNTPFDFTTEKPMGRDILADNEQLRCGKGYDHNYVINGSGLRLAASGRGDKTGIVMKVWSDQPGLQFYSGNLMEGRNHLRKGRDEFRTAFCLETQHFPDSPNEPGFPSTVLRPGETFRSETVYQFFKLWEGSL
jgi:aldose 1-epimerase